MILDYFQQINNIPRESGHEEQIRDFLIDWAKGKGFEFNTDKTGNLVIYVPATPDKEDSESIILQAHMDMVCVKTEDSNHDFGKDPIKVLEKDGWLYADGTTLGADNGIGMAMMIASSELDSHPALELLFTVEEEIGLKGALGLDTSMLSSKKVINLDTEDEGEICISSAGGARIEINSEYEGEEPRLKQYEISIKGMKGGHSGIEIGEKRGNAIYLLIEFLADLDLNYELVSIEGGVGDNVIPSEAKAVIGLDYAELFQSKLNEFLNEYRTQNDCPHLTFDINETEETSDTTPFYMMQSVRMIPVGVYSMSEKIPGLVQTSLNLGTMKLKDGKLSVVYLPRSSVESELEKIVKDIETSYKRYNMIVKIKNRYPGWQDSPKSELVKKIKPIMKKVLGKNPKVVAYHAGLECGALVDKLGEEVHAISIGPTIKGAHSLEEKCKVDSVEKYWEILKEVLSSL